MTDICVVCGKEIKKEEVSHKYQGDLMHFYECKDIYLGKKKGSKVVTKKQKYNEPEIIKVVVTDIDISIGQMMVLTLKWLVVCLIFGLFILFFLFLFNVL
tara:strand:+ start:305 stop:604 length:300 start_codon:yes stop_codon:yes gene_type:complete